MSLWKAVESGNNGEIERIISAGADLEELGRGVILLPGPRLRIIVHGSPLHCAAAKGNYFAAKKLVDCGANVLALNPRGDSSMHAAAVGGNAEIVQMLIEKGARTDLLDVDGDPPLNWAAQFGQVATLRRLLAAGAAVGVAGEKGNMAVHWAALRGSGACLSALVDAGANVNVGNERGATPLHIVARQGALECTRILILGGADPNSRTRHGATSLHNGAASGSADVVRVLLNKGARTDVFDADGDSPLNWAAENGQIDTLRVLLSAGASMSVQGKYGNMSLHWAARVNSGACVRMLLEHGADASIRNEQGKLPIELTENEDVKSIFRRHQDQVLELQGQLEAARSKIAALISENRSLRQDLASARSKYTDLEHLYSIPLFQSPVLSHLLRPPPPHQHRDPASYPKDLDLFELVDPTPQSLPGGSNGAVAILKLSADPSSPPVAAKLVFNLGAMSTSQAALNVKSEYQNILRLPRHSNIVRMYWESMCTVPESLFERLPLDEATRDLCTHVNPVTGQRRIPKFATLLLEAHPHTLQHHLTTLPPGFRPWPLLLRWFRDLAAAVSHLYLHRIAHLDLKLDNIMVAEDDQRLVLVDFGSSIHFPLPTSPPIDASLYESGLGVCSSLKPKTPLRDILPSLQHPPPFQINAGWFASNRSSPFGNAVHVSPEVQNAFVQAGNLRDGSKIIDYTHQPVFALGMIFGELLTGEIPIEDYPRSNSPAEYPAVSPYELGPSTLLSTPHPYPPKIVSLITQMLSFDPHNRPTLDQVLEILFCHL